MKTFLIATALGCMPLAQSVAQTADATPTNVQQVFQVSVYENDPTQLLDVEQEGDTRGFFDVAWQAIRSSYKTTVAGQVSSLSADILSSGIGWLVESMRSKRTDWQRQLMADCSYSRQMPMPQEITDFYANPSEKGAMDPAGILFNGFGCSKHVTYTDSQGRQRTLTAFDIKCSMRTDQTGLDRILHHGKFEVVLEHLYINPLLCDLPNDSLSERDIKLRTPFDFQRRRNLKFNIETVITSSWMNQLMQIEKDFELGRFNINVVIPDESALEADGEYPGYFVYNRPVTHEDSLKMAGKMVSVTGDCFLVPRSYIGSSDMRTAKNVWGTGQYKVNMTLKESCDVNWSFYLKDDPRDQRQARAENAVVGGIAKQGHTTPGVGMTGRAVMPPVGKEYRWNQYWTEEWNLMKQRRRAGKTFWGGIWNNVKVNYANNRWVYTLLEPVATTVLTQESGYVNKYLDQWFKISSPQMPTSVGAAAAGRGTAPAGGR